MKDVIIPRSSKMGTKLWFDEPPEGQRSDLDTLLAAGQVTTCHNLLKHIWTQRHERGASAQERDERDPFFEAVKEDWEKFLDDAFWLLDATKASWERPVTEPKSDTASDEAGSEPEGFRSAMTADQAVAGKSKQKPAPTD